MLLPLDSQLKSLVVQELHPQYCKLEFLEWPVTFPSEHSNDDHEQGARQHPGQFTILKISKFDIGIIKILFCSIAKVESLVLKMKI